MGHFKHIGAALLLITLVGCSAMAQQGSSISNAQIMSMDMNKDGRLTKDEYLLAMGKVFDRHAGAKGYCTPDEAQAVMRDINAFKFGDTPSR